MHSYKNEIKKVFFATLVTSVITAGLFAFNGSNANNAASFSNAQSSNWSNMAQLQAALL